MSLSSLFHHLGVVALVGEVGMLPNQTNTLLHIVHLPTVSLSTAYLRKIHG